MYTTVYKLGREPSPKTNSASTLIMDFPTSRTEKKSSLFFKLSGYGMSSQQPQVTKTMIKLWYIFRYRNRKEMVESTGNPQPRENYTTNYFFLAKPWALPWLPSRASTWLPLTCFPYFYLFKYLKIQNVIKLISWEIHYIFHIACSGFHVWNKMPMGHTN